MSRFFDKRREASRRRKLPKFRYIADNTLPFRRDAEGVPCACCGELTHEVYEGGFADSAFTGALCPACVVSVRACQTFDASFHDAEQCEQVNSPMAMETLEHCTPGLNTDQPVQWPACCGDYCVFLREMTAEDFENEELMEELADDIAAWEIPEEAVEETRALLFRCPTCGKYRVFFDLD